MGFFDNKENVEEYIKMIGDADGRALINILQNHLKAGATVLELGMGPGKDLDILAEHFQVTGSDNSMVFVERYKKQNPKADVVLLDAVEMNINRTFDCIYSNKVLHHLTKADLKKSLEAQLNVLNDGGILFHALWYGDKEEEFSGLRFVYYTEAMFKELLGNAYEIVVSERYTEMEDDDSIYFILKKR